MRGIQQTNFWSYVTLHQGQLVYKEPVLIFEFLFFKSYLNPSHFETAATSSSSLPSSPQHFSSAPNYHTLHLPSLTLPLTYLTLPDE